MSQAQKQVQIINEKGLHARASAKFVEVVEAHDAAVTVAKDGTEVTGDSIMGLLMLGAARGSTIDISATGPQAEAVIAALETLIADYFGEGM